MAETGVHEFSVELDEATLQQSLMKVRGLMFEINSVRNLAQDTMRMAADPSLSNAFWLGMQVQMTTRRVRMLPETLEDLQAGITGFAGRAAAFLGPYALPVGVIAAGAAVVGGVLMYRQEQEKAFNDWQRRQTEVAKQQGLTP